MNMRNGLAALTAGFLLMSVSGGVSGQTPQTMANNPLEARKAMLAARAARLSQQAPSAPETGVKPDGTGGGPGPTVLTTLYNFEGSPDGATPSDETLAIGSCGELYGTTSFGGVSNNGTVFVLTPPKTPGDSWNKTTLYAFTGGSDGAYPSTGVVIGPGGVLYGLTGAGGTSNYGTAFALVPPRAPDGSWTKETLYSFTGISDGANPQGLVLGSDGRLYGTTDGYVPGPSYNGTVFSLTPPAFKGGSWTETTLYVFASCADNGCIPYGGVVVGAGGVLYGTTFYGGPTANGTVYSLTPPRTRDGSWTQSVLYSFSGSDGSGPYVGVVIGRDGVLYGVTQYGGSSYAGTVFSLTPPRTRGGSWTESVIHSFSYSDGANPVGALAIGPGEVLYSTTANGGDFGSGTVFSLAPPRAAGGLWTETVLHSFDYTDGANVVDGLVIAPGPPSQGLVLYGTTPSGGALGQGTVFEVRLGR